MRTNNTIRNIFAGLTNKIIVLFVPFLVRTVLVNKLGVNYVGVSSLFTSILDVLNVTELGFSAAIVFSLYDPVARNDIQEIKKQVNLLASVYKFLGILVLAIGLIITPFLPQLVKDDIPDDINLYIAFLIFLMNPVISYLFYGYKNSILIVYQRNDLVSKIHSLTSLIKGIIQLIVLYTVKDFYLYSIIIPCTTLLGNLLVNQLSNHYFPELCEKSVFSFEGIGKLKKQIAGVAIGRISLVCRNSFDSIILTALFGLAVTGIYSNYYMVFSLVCGFMSVLITSIAAGVGNSLVTETKEKNESDHLRFDFYYMFTASLCSICLFCLYQPFMKVWVGDDFMLPYSSMILFCVYFYVNQLAQIRGAYSQAAGLWWSFKYLSFTEMLANLVLNVLLGCILGVDGILIATIITAFLCSFIGCTVITYKKIFEKSSRIYFVYNIYYMIVAAIGCLSVNYFTSKFLVECWLDLFIKALLCAFLSFSYLLLVYGLNRNTRADIFALINKLKCFLKNNTAVERR